MCYANLRPCKTYAGVQTRFDEIDIVVVRENLEDLYAGIEFEEGAGNALELIHFIRAHHGSQIPTDSGITIKPISVEGSRRIVKFAFEYARANGRKAVTAIHKANIQKHSDGLFLRVAREVAEDYPGYRVLGHDSGRYVHAACAPAGTIRRHGHAELVWRYSVRPLCRAGGRSWCGSRREHRRSNGALRAHPRQCAQVHGSKQSKPHGPDVFRGDDAAPHWRARRRGAGWRQRSRTLSRRASTSPTT